ncbi:MAG: ATP-binding protein [Pseudomonadota bacterium]
MPSDFAHRQPGISDPSDARARSASDAPAPPGQSQQYLARQAPCAQGGALAARSPRRPGSVESMQLAQQQLLHDEMRVSMGQLAAGLAHEINGPIGFMRSNLGSLQSYASTLLALVQADEHAIASEGAPPATVAAFARARAHADLAFVRQDVAALIAESMAGLTRIAELVQSLRDFAHAGEPDWQVADLHRGLDSTLALIGSEIRYKAVVERCYGRVPPFPCLAAQLNHVFMNVLANAAYAIVERGVITIRTGSDAGWAWVEIADTGCGIAPENLARIFYPFFTTKPAGSGTGLGLSLSYGIVNQHGGRIDVASTLGQGSRFTIRLPLERRAHARANH